MADGIEFEGANCVYRGDGDSVMDLHVFRNSGCLVSQWRLRPEELEEIVRTGIVALSVHSHQLPPVFVGSVSTVRQLAADYGEVWRIPKPPSIEEQTKDWPGRELPRREP